MSIHLPISYSKVKIWIVAIIIATNEGITKVLSNFNITTFVYSVNAKKRRKRDLIFCKIHILDCSLLLWKKI